MPVIRKASGPGPKRPMPGPQRPKKDQPPEDPPEDENDEDEDEEEHETDDENDEYSDSDDDGKKDQKDHKNLNTKSMRLKRAQNFKKMGKIKAPGTGPKVAELMAPNAVMNPSGDNIRRKSPGAAQQPYTQYQQASPVPEVPALTPVATHEQPAAPQHQWSPLAPVIFSQPAAASTTRSYQSQLQDVQPWPYVASSPAATPGPVSTTYPTPSCPSRLRRRTSQPYVGGQPSYFYPQQQPGGAATPVVAKAAAATPRVRQRRVLADYGNPPATPAVGGGNAVIEAAEAFHEVHDAIKSAKDPKKKKRKLVGNGFTSESERSGNKNKDRSPRKKRVRTAQVPAVKTASLKSLPDSKAAKGRKGPVATAAAPAPQPAFGLRADQNVPAPVQPPAAQISAASAAQSYSARGAPSTAVSVVLSPKNLSRRKSTSDITGSASASALASSSFLAPSSSQSSAGSIFSDLTPTRKPRRSASMSSISASSNLGVASTAAASTSQSSRHSTTTYPAVSTTTAAPKFEPPLLKRQRSSTLTYAAQPPQNYHNSPPTVFGNTTPPTASRMALYYPTGASNKRATAPPPRQQIISKAAVPPMMTASASLASSQRNRVRNAYGRNNFYLTSQSPLVAV